MKSFGGVPDFPSKSELKRRGIVARNGVIYAKISPETWAAIQREAIEVQLSGLKK